MERPFRPRWWLPSLVALSAAAAAFAGCSGGDEGQDSPGNGGAGGDGAPACLSTREYFAKQAWPTVFGKICVKCHTPDGVAAEQSAKLVLQPPSYPGFLDANLETIAEVVAIEYSGTPELLVKPTNQVAHGGGVQIEPGSAEYQTLTELVTRLRSTEAEACPEQPAVASFPDAVLLDGPGTLRKAALNLVGRLPTSDETAQVEAGGDAALASVLSAMMKEDAFSERLQEMWNDLLLTDRYLSYTGRAIGLLSKSQYPGASSFDTAADDASKVKMNLAVAREPLQLIAHVVREGRPFSEIVTAPYTLVNGWSAPIYGVAAPSSEDPDVWGEAQVTAQTKSAGAAPIPHAGVLTSPMFLNRFPTTQTNRNRHRAYAVLDLFLATDILSIAQRPIDPTTASSYANPTRDDPTCRVCHQILDPIAGTFRTWDDNDQELYAPDRDWYTNMEAPGWGHQIMPTSENARAPQWLGQRLAADPRFGIASVYTMFEALTGREPLRYPDDPSAPDFEGQLAAWQAQDATLRAIERDFEKSNQDLRTVITGIVTSPYFRAVGTVGTPDPSRTAILASLGTGRLSTPESLARKIRAVTGRPWSRGWDKKDWLVSDYRILYGGIDSDVVDTRLRAMNGVMASVALRMADEVACQTVPWEFGKPDDRRLLFAGITMDHEPEADTGDPIPASVAKIKATIRALYARVLGETLAEDDPEVERAYQLFYDTWKQGKASLASKAENAWLPWPCASTKDPETGADLPDAEKVQQDPRYTARAWMAVVTYLLSDWRFLYE